MPAKVKADVNLRSWGDGAVGTDFEFDLEAGILTVLVGNGNDYRFYSETEPNSNVPDDIVYVRIDPNVTGDFTILIDNPDPNIAGAVDLLGADLRHPNGPINTCTVLGIHLSGALARKTDPPNADVLCDAIVGDINVGRIAQNATDRKLSAETMVGNLSMNLLQGIIELDSFDGDITTGGFAGGANTPGDIIIGSDYDGSILIDDGFNGLISIAGDSRALSR